MMSSWKIPKPFSLYWTVCQSLCLFLMSILLYWVIFYLSSFALDFLFWIPIVNILCSPMRTTHCRQRSSSRRGWQGEAHSLLWPLPHMVQLHWPTRIVARTHIGWHPCGSPLTSCHTHGPQLHSWYLQGTNRTRRRLRVPLNTCWISCGSRSDGAGVNINHRPVGNPNRKVWWAQQQFSLSKKPRFIEPVGESQT
jgi:hypothetical protein